MPMPMHGIIDEKFIYIDESGKVYDRSSLFEAVRAHELTLIPMST